MPSKYLTKVCFEFSIEFLKGKKALYLTNIKYISFLAFKGQVNKDFNYVISLLKENIYKFFFLEGGRSNTLFGEVSPKICKNSFLSFPIFFFAKLLSLKGFVKKDAEACSELSQTSKMDLFA